MSRLHKRSMYEVAWRFKSQTEWFKLGIYTRMFAEKIIDSWRIKFPTCEFVMRESYESSEQRLN